MSDEKQKLIGRRIRAAREEAGLSQEQLGEMIGYSAMGVSHLESGDRKIKLEDLQKIAEKLEADINYLLEPIAKLTFPSALYRRGDEEISEEQKKVEREAMKKLDDLIKNMDS